jgi:large subunit ribosomal protein L22
MRTQATARFVRVSARKARLVLDQIRDQSVSDALATLQYTPRAAARLVEKVLRSAVANAEHNHQVRDLDALRVVHAIADGGPSLKRVQPRAMGRAFFIKHRTSHLTIGVSDEVNGARPVAPPRHMRRPRREDAPAAAEQAAPAARTERRGEQRERPGRRATPKAPTAKGRTGRRSRG